jgi:hypothetical protein
MVSYLTEEHIRCPEAGGGGFSGPPVRISFLPIIKTKEKLNGLPVFQAPIYWFFSCREELIRQIAYSAYADTKLDNTHILLCYNREIPDDLIVNLKKVGGIISGDTSRADTGAISGITMIQYLEREAGWDKSRLYFVKNVKFSKPCQTQRDNAHKATPGLYSMSFYALELGKKWTANPYLLSLALLIMRFFILLKIDCADHFLDVNVPIFRSYKEFDTFISRLSALKIPDSAAIQKTYQYWLPILVYYDDLFSKLPSLYKQHSSAGIITLVEDQVEHLARGSFEKLRHTLLCYHYHRLGKAVPYEQISIARRAVQERCAQLVTTC